MLSKLRDWSIMNQLEITTKKNTAVLFRSKNKPVNSNINIMYGDKTIEMVTSMKTLGITFSSNIALGRAY